RQGRGGREPGAAARGARAREAAHSRGPALPARRAGRPQGRALGRQAVDAADPRRRDAAEEGVMISGFHVIASDPPTLAARATDGFESAEAGSAKAEAKRSPAVRRRAEIASSRFALLGRN